MKFLFPQYPAPEHDVRADLCILTHTPEGQTTLKNRSQSKIEKVTSLPNRQLLGQTAEQFYDFYRSILSRVRRILRTLVKWHLQRSSVSSVSRAQIPLVVSDVFFLYFIFFLFRNEITFWDVK